MPTKSQGSIHLLRIAGIDIYLHWMWFVVALFEIQGRSRGYSSIVWNVLEYLSLFAIVLLHEFGHALACRTVGGTANKILLWPFGGVAYVDPPQRPGAVLWSLFAGPLVNIVLLPILWGAFQFAKTHGWAYSMHNEYLLIRSVFAIDIGLLVFNMLPIYPLDGGQILRALFWFVLGRARSLMAVTVFSFFGIAGLFALAVWWRSIWSAAIAVYMLMNCWGGLQRARALLRIAKLPRRVGFACPSCRTAPPLGAYWKCQKCEQPFDTFATRATCPNCAAQYSGTRCLDCGVSSPMQSWIIDPVAASGATISSSAVLP